MIIHLKEEANDLLENIKEKFAVIKGKCGLAIVTVGDDPASLTYVKNKIKKSESVPNVTCSWIKLDADITQEKLDHTIEVLNNDSAIHGILLQQPLPAHLSAQGALDHIKLAKDIDGLTDINKRFLYTGNAPYSITPCTALGVLMFLKGYHQENNEKIEGKTVLIIGRSDLVGRPLAHAMEECNATLIWANSYTPKEVLIALSQQADIIISAAGAYNLIHSAHVNTCKHQLFIDVGINRTFSGEMAGDCSLNELAAIDLCDVTAVPGGVGQLTTSVLFYNLYKCWEWQNA